VPEEKEEIKRSVTVWTN